MKQSFLEQEENKKKIFFFLLKNILVCYVFHSKMLGKGIFVKVKDESS